MRYPSKLSAFIAAMGIISSQPLGLEARVQSGVPFHAKTQHAEFFRIEIHDKARELVEGSTPVQSGKYNELVDKVILDYGLPFKRADIAASSNFSVGYISDKVLINCDIPGPDGSRVHAIWVSADRVDLGGTRRDGSPLSADPYKPKH